MSIFNHENLIPLDSNLKLWRYLDQDKFKSLLQARSLFFCRADKFSDPFEGSIPKKEWEYRNDQGRFMSDGTEVLFEIQKGNIKGIQRIHRNYRRKAIVNCWHINTVESDAMWRLYLKDNEGVAIQTNTERIHETLASIPENIIISKVRYINYETDGWYHSKEYPHRNYNFYTPLLHKKAEFVHEHECRLIYEVDEAFENEKYWENQPYNNGKLISINLETLIEKIYLPPTIDDYSINKIERIARELGYKFQFEKSTLVNEPLY